ncbi:ABC transporter permease [Reinekea sp.]|jgi:ABC-2 type transport system permease protein|uniref:ABC transporter permease n=1 Tax=Reinekea sp. TaxID=1970455 RepID=UPI003988AEED
MNLFITGLNREWQRIISQPSYWASLFLLPLVAFVIVWAIVITPNITDVSLDIVDLDGSKASRDLAFRLDASASVVVEHILHSEQRALERAKGKESFGFLVIPKGYHGKLVSGQFVELNAYVNQQNFMLGNILSNQIIRQVIEDGTKESALELMMGGQIKEQALANVYPLKLSRSVLGNSYLNYQSFLLAALLPHLWHVIVMMVTVIALGSEFKNGSVKQWMQVSNNRLSLAMLTKFSVPVLVMAIWICLIDIFVFRMLGAGGYASLGSLLVASWLTQLCYHFAGFLIVAITTNYRLSLSAAAFYTTPAFAFVGVTFPTFNMNWMSQLWQSLLPISVLIQVQNDILHWGATLFDVWPKLTIVALYALLFGVLGMLTIRKKLYDKHYWFKH